MLHVVILVSNASVSCTHALVEHPVLPIRLFLDWKCFAEVVFDAPESRPELSSVRCELPWSCIEIALSRLIHNRPVPVAAVLSDILLIAFEIRSWEVRRVVLSEQDLDSCQLLTIILGDRHANVDVRVMHITTLAPQSALESMTDFIWC